MKHGEIWTAVGCVLLGGAVALGTATLLGRDADARDAGAGDNSPPLTAAALTNLPGPNDALRQQLDELRARLAALEARPAPVPSAEAASQPSSEPSPELAARLARLEELAASLQAVLPQPQQANTGAEPPPDAKAAAQLAAQLLDPTLGMRTRIESLEVLAKVPAGERPFAKLDPAAVGDFLHSIPNPERRGRSYRTLRRHVDRSWIPVLTAAAQRETDDKARADIVEAMHLLRDEADVRAFLGELRRSPQLGPKSADTIDDLLR